MGDSAEARTEPSPATPPAETRSAPDGPASAPSPAVAPPPANPRFALFDSLRGIAVMSIVIFHVAQFTGGLFDSWWGRYVGVLAHSLYAFFVISAFLLYRPFVSARVKGRPLRISDYARRRALRILPAYWVALTVLALWPGVTGPFSDDWYVFYGFGQSYEVETFGLGIAPAWSLCVEMTFYLLLPFWALAARRVSLGSGSRSWMRGELALIGAFFLLGMVVRLLGNHGTIDKLWAVNLPGQASWLAIGMALAVVSVGLDEHRSRLAIFVRSHAGLLWAGAIAAFIALAVTQPAPVLTTFEADLGAPPVKPPILDLLWDEIFFTFLSLSLAALYVLPAVWGQSEGGWPRRILSWKAIGWIGVISYSMYLWHYTIGILISVSPDTLLYPRALHPLGVSNYVPEGLVTIVAALLTLCATIAVAAVSYYAVELPFLRQKERRLLPALKRKLAAGRREAPEVSRG